MTAVTTSTLVETRVPGMHTGTILAANAYTTKFGFKHCTSAVVCASSDNDGIAGVAVSSGSGTISLIDDAGSAITTAATLNYVAFGYL